MNQIAAVVHRNIVRYGGAPNKNIGDAFVFVWKICSYQKDQKLCRDIERFIRGKDTMSFSDKKVIQIVADLSIISILEVIHDMETQKSMLCYRKHQGLNKRMPNYSIRIGYGMQLGWGIEGLIGTPHKIDPSYLSPAATISNQLEESTKIYGSSVLLSEHLVKFVSPDVKKILRCVDKVLLPGQAIEFRIYCIDFEVSHLLPLDDEYEGVHVFIKQEQIRL